MEDTQAFKVVWEPVHTRFGLVVNNHYFESFRVERGEQFFDFFKNYPVPKTALARLNTIPKSQFDFRKLKLGDPYSLIINNDSVCSVRALVLEPSPLEYVIFHFSDTLVVEKCTRQVQTRSAFISGRIESNLSEAIQQAGVSHALTNKMVDVLGWQIDFYRLQKGDSFRVAYQQQFAEDRYLGIGEVEGIEFLHGGKSHWAIPFSQQGRTEYFDREGNSIRKAFLKYPIEFTHISSRYSLKRFHPVLKVNRPHLGTDLAAATGTPIRASGDGTVVEAGYNSGSGNYVKIRHNSTYTTGYLHMSRIGAGIKRGAPVRQGQVIGFVGSTGWATGPHLCYRFWKNGVQVDALRVALPSAMPVEVSLKENFKCQALETAERMAAYQKYSQIEPL